MLSESFLIMAVGMSSVFVFLGILVISLQISGRFFADWPLDETPQNAQTNTHKNKHKNKKTDLSEDHEDEDVLIAIALAAIQHQKSHL